MAAKPWEFSISCDSSELGTAVKLALVCGPWGSGTSVVAGQLTRIGVLGVGPYLRTNDPLTPNSYESIPFREIILRYSDELTISLKPHMPGAVQSSIRQFRRWIAREKKRSRDHHDWIFFKYPLAVLFIREICEIFKTKLIYVERPLAAIEQTRRRRLWPPHLGAAGAVLIYQQMSAVRERHNYPIMIVRYEELLEDPLGHARGLASLTGLNPTRAELDQAAEFVRKPRPACGSGNLRRRGA